MKTPSPQTLQAIDASADIKEYYSAWWENSKDIRESVFQRLNRKVSHRLESIPGKIALDLGSGRGAIVRMLANQGFAVTAVEFNSEFANDLRETFPTTEVVCADVRKWSPSRIYDITTCIEVTQVISHKELLALLKRVRPFTKRLLINISNANSFHGRWVRLRRFQAPFIVGYTPNVLRDLLSRAGYRLLHEEGIGILTPVSLLRDFQLVVVNTRLAENLSKLDSVFPQQCHLYLVDAEPKSEEKV